MIFIISFSAVRVLWTAMNALGTTVNHFWVRIFDYRRRYSDIIIEENFMTTPPGTSAQSTQTCQHPNYLQLNYESDFTPHLTFCPYLQDMTHRETDYMSYSMVRSGKAPLPSKGNCFKNKSADKGFHRSHRITTAAQMKNHPLRKTTGGLKRQSSEERDDKTKISQQNSPRLSLQNFEKNGVKSKKMISTLNSRENTPGIKNLYKENIISPAIKDLTSGDFDREPFDNNYDSSMKIKTEKGEDDFDAHYKLCQMEDNHIDVSSHLEDMIRKINRLSKGKKILKLINDELVLIDNVPSSSNQNDKSDNTWIKFISEDQNTAHTVRYAEDDVTNSSPKFFSKGKTTTFDKYIKGINENGIRLENADIKKDELLPKYSLDDLVKEDGIKFPDKTILRIGPIPRSKIFNIGKKIEKSITSTENNLMTLNLNSDLHGNSDLSEWKVKYDIITPDYLTVSSKNSIKPIKNFQVKADDNAVVEKINPTENVERSEHVIMGCCQECRPKPYSYKCVVYNIPQQEENGTNLFEKNVGKCFLKYEDVVSESPGKNIEKTGNILESSPSNTKPCCSKTDRQDHFSSSTDSPAYGLHKNVFKKFNPRSFLLLPTPTSKNCIRAWEGVKKDGKSSEILLEKGSREFLKKTSAREFEKEIHDDESPLISLENESSDSLMSKSVFKYSDLSSSEEWQSFFERTFKTESVVECGAEDCLGLRKRTQFMSTPKNMPSKRAASGRNSESFLRHWTNSRKKTEVQKSMKKLCNKIKNA